MDKEISLVDFVNIKKQILKNVDNSKKGSIDAPILTLLDKLNASPDLVTTSSCSGRIIVISQKTPELQKKNCQWILNSHDLVDEEEFIQVINEAEGHLTLKFEPFILHVQSRSLTVAKSLLDVGLSSGYRNSGIVLGKHGKIVVAIRSTSNLEIPLSNGEKLLTSDEFLRHCIQVSNEKLSKNFDQIKRLEAAISYKI